MIIDTHAHIGHIPDFNMTTEQLLYSMERYGVDFTLFSHIEAVEFDHMGNAGEFMQAVADEGEKLDIVLMDPPRAGSSEQFLNALIRLAPPKVVYVSCNPETLARDLAYLRKNSPYRVQQIQPVDMFPHTAHVECVVKLMKHNGEGR